MKKGRFFNIKYGRLDPSNVRTKPNVRDRDFQKKKIIDFLDELRFFMGEKLIFFKRKFCRSAGVDWPYKEVGFSHGTPLVWGPPPSHSERKGPIIDQGCLNYYSQTKTRNTRNTYHHCKMVKQYFSASKSYISS
jgi:hypothetical protein